MWSLEVKTKLDMLMKTRSMTSLGLAMCLSLTAAVTVFTGCAGSRYDRSTGEYIDDKTLAYRVSHAVHADSEYKLGGVDAKAFRGNVQLSGFVVTQPEKDRAGEIARSVPGVRSVENNITVKTSLSQNP